MNMLNQSGAWGGWVVVGVGGVGWSMNNSYCTIMSVQKTWLVN